MKDQAERQRGFDGNLGVLQLPSALADAHGLPRGDRFRRQPQGDVASLDQCSVVRRPVSDAVFRFVPGMHSRLHVEIMPLRPSRWPGPRRTLVTAHQRHVATDIVFPVSGRVVTRKPGHLLWPAREGPTELALQRRQLGSTAFDTQYQQRPAPAGGRLFKRAWFKFYDEPPRVSTWLASWDMSFKGGPSNDYVVGLQAAREGADVYLVDRVKGQWDFTETRRQVVRLHGRYPETQTTLIEEAANGPAIINVLTGQIAGIIPVRPDGGKYARAEAAAPMVEAGNVWLPDPQPHGRSLPERAWVNDFLHQLCVFPTGAHDDDVDAFSQLIARCVRPESNWLVW